MKSSVMILVMIIVQSLEMGLNTLTKAAMNKGMSTFVFIVYSNALAIFILLISFFFFYRKLSPTYNFNFIQNFSTWFTWIFMNAGVKYSSPTLASAMADLVPAFTFIFAIICRMENIDLRVKSSLAKSIGTLVSIAGALIMTLYKGLPITTTLLPNDPIKELHLPQSNWIFGGFLAATGSFVLAVLFIVQTWIIKDYPEEIIVTLIACVFTTIFSTIAALIAEKDPNAWRLKPDVELIAIGYSAVFVVTLRSLVYTWACRKKGPLFVAMFNPLGMVIALIMGIMFLGDALYLGSLIGAAVVALGFYAVICGKAKEEKTVDHGSCSSIDSCCQKVPLLPNENP